ncbi:MAG: hypothetical protein JSR62_15845 [Nitrospira sp.]|nr:hypothetical protein [Nitrospira sp.]
MRYRSFLFLVGLVAVGLTGCSHHHGSYAHGKGDYYWSKASEDVSGLIDKHVKNPETAKQVNVVMGEMITEIKSAREQHRQSHRALYELNANYSASPEEFTKILDELNTNRMRSAAKILGLRFKMKSLLTAEEWTAMSDDLKRYGSRYYGTGSEGSSAH